ncbi:DUF4892 domain-containing protein [Teredinibacter waterburyi]|uniref:DUF4892 domain-containing protein n=1 Tax=Teredinibacter waterburyi TaxID=1500538 RepID=UPI00165F69AC|nr:DUF4892 domain-containing protein [Teredinibacter waterburyi]
MPRSFRFSLVLSLVVATASVSSAIAGANPLFDLFAEHRAIFQSEQTNSTYRLVLSAPKKINNEWVNDRAELLRGDLRRATVELVGQDNFQKVVDQLEAYGSSGRAIYSCTGLDCGSSNAWANEIFNVKQLYGLDQYQYYAVWELANPQANGIAVAYLVQRGNKRLYLQLEFVKLRGDQLDTLEADPSTILMQLQDKKYYVLTIPRFDGPNMKLDRHVQALANTLKRKPSLSVVLVGHDYGLGSLQQRLDRSQAYAEALKEALVGLGIKADRLTVKGLGPLTPQGKTRSWRLEVVVL